MRVNASEFVCVRVCAHFACEYVYVNAVCTSPVGCPSARFRGVGIGYHGGASIQYLRLLIHVLQLYLCAEHGADVFVEVLGAGSPELIKRRCLDGHDHAGGALEEASPPIITWNRNKNNDNDNDRGRGKGKGKEKGKGKGKRKGKGKGKCSVRQLNKLVIIKYQ